MRRASLTIALALATVLPGCGEGESAVHQRLPSYESSRPSGSPPYDYYLTAYGGPDDSCYQGTPACGGKVVDGAWYYATGAAAYGCHSKLKLAANGTCVVVEVVDNGPASWVEQKAGATCGGRGAIIDASPLVAKKLFGVSSAGWSDCLAIEVTPVDASTPAGPIACGPVGPPPPACGDGKLDTGELCDTAIPSGYAGSCPTSCDDADPCTVDVRVGTGCQVACKHNNNCITPSCGNGKLDTGELCDTAIPSGYAGSCPTSCEDADPCTVDVRVGTGCQVACKHNNTCITPSPSCGDGKLDAGEWCDTGIPAGYAGACPTSCDDGDPCTEDHKTGTGCLTSCANPRISQCGSAEAEAALPTGSPCTGNAQCLTGQCLPAQSGFPGGFCSQACVDVCPRADGDVASACVLLNLNSPSLGAYCYPRCDREAGCRTDYACATRDALDGISQDVCVPEMAPAADDTPADEMPAVRPILKGGCSVGTDGAAPLAPSLLLLGILVALRRSRG